jgi:hypothetical protein
MFQNSKGGKNASQGRGSAVSNPGNTQGPLLHPMHDGSSGEPMLDRHHHIRRSMMRHGPKRRMAVYTGKRVEKPATSRTRRGVFSKLSGAIFGFVVGRFLAVGAADWSTRRRWQLGVGLGIGGSILSAVTWKDYPWVSGFGAGLGASGGLTTARATSDAIVEYFRETFPFCIWYPRINPVPEGGALYFPLPGFSHMMNQGQAMMDIHRVGIGAPSFRLGF